MQIPKIIHQIFEGRNGDKPSNLLLILADTWKNKNPDWEYRFWNYQAIDEFLSNKFPDFIEKYHSFPHNVQRWDAIRYLILFEMGGIYADLDSECLEPIDKLIENKTCCLGLDPSEHSQIFGKPFIITNAFIAVIPNHLFFQQIIDEISNVHSDSTDIFNYVLETTGPYMLNRLYNRYLNKSDIYLVPSEFTSPLSKNEVAIILQGMETSVIEAKIEKAYAVHYFFGTWYR